MGRFVRNVRPIRNRRSRANNMHRIRQNREQLVRRGYTLYKTQILNNPNLQATPMSATQLRNLQTSISETGGIRVQPGTAKWARMLETVEHLQNIHKDTTPESSHNHALHEKKARTANGFGALTDVDGNVIHIDENDLPFIFDQDLNKVLINVYQLPYDHHRNVCTIDSSGNALVSVLKEVPVIRDWDGR